MIKCKYYEPSHIVHNTMQRKEYVENGICRLGNEIPIGGCSDDCPDFESIP
jgi:hypothetical protein